MFRTSSLPKLKRFLCGVAGVVGIAFGLYSFRAACGFSYRNWFGGGFLDLSLLSSGLLHYLGLF